MVRFELQAAAPPRPLASSMFQTVLSACFLAAFLSYYSNFYGLLSKGGVTPLDDALLLSFHTVSLPPFLFFPARVVQLTPPPQPLVAFLGVSLSSLSTTYSPIRTVSIPALTLLYSYLLRVVDACSEAPFYHFQWDSLLVESGAMASVQLILHYLCPFGLWSSRFRSPGSIIDHLPRVLLFKLMFMSALVKIQSGCPTWLHLTALEYHYATQPLPSSLGWYALNLLPPYMHRLSVASTFVIELAAPFLLLAPSSRIRTIGSMLQVFLQIVIAATGSYTFFNLLTLGLALAVLEGSDGWHEAPNVVVAVGTNVRTPPAAAAAAAADLWSKATSLLTSVALRSAALTLLALSCAGMFALGFYGPAAANPTERGGLPASFAELFSAESLARLSIKFKMSPEDANRLADNIVPHVMTGILCYGLLVGSKDVWFAVVVAKGAKKQPSLATSLWRLSKAAAAVVVCLVYISALAFPLVSLTPALKSNFSSPSTPPLALGHFFFGQCRLGPMPCNVVSNGYGLFRRMTGVDHGALRKYAQDTKWGWAGLPPSVVARPEVVIEGRWETTSESGEQAAATNADEGWRELKFWFKPGALDKRPRYAAPYQPRLDWQMWFAALGSYQQNPWLISLMDKLLSGCPDVVEMLDETPETIQGMTHIRAYLYDYDFTRIDNEWNRRIPGVEVLTKSSWPRWWSRKNKREYIPAVEKGNASVKEFLKSHRIATSCDHPSSSESTENASALEEWTQQLRAHNGIWSPVLLVFASAAVLKLRKLGFIGKTRREKRWEESKSSSPGGSNVSAEAAPKPTAATKKAVAKPQMCGTCADDDRDKKK